MGACQTHPTSPPKHKKCLSHTHTAAAAAEPLALQVPMSAVMTARSGLNNQVSIAMCHSTCGLGDQLQQPMHANVSLFLPS